MCKTATETFQLIKQAYGDNALSRTRVFEWYARFRDGSDSVEDDERSGRPTAVPTPDMFETVSELISTDRRMTLRMMEEELLCPFVQSFRRVRPQFHARGSWFLLHDNARPHTAVSVEQFLAKLGIPEFQN
jgi:transposase